MESILEAIFRFLFEAVFQFILYGTGWVLIPALTLGLVHSEDFNSKAAPGRSYYWRDRKGIVLSTDMTMLVGLLFWVSVVVAAVIYFKRS
ncbi:hypothetical protein UNDKW_3943 [Undibacterium sp. KW1]|uniref:hypothetical protein n=1 Tax=Undibacterium sp. KW1 TaxID=2058624 RepID=UPI001331E934|nr:hypothetical protein [Undibacterium sp. KW1]BBB62216.1 hypothetical protein UNDKW_3943 [Undibacterium sp. KW1]